MRLHEPCVERGGDPLSTSACLRGILATYFDTTLPRGSIHACHSCNNNKCTSLVHAYWGTAKENRFDAKINGKGSAWDNTVAKYGIIEAKKLQLKASKSRKNFRGGAKNPHRPPTKIEWPPVEELVAMVKESSYTETARRLGVSDVSVHDRLERKGFRRISKFSMPA